jgi:hypothetical protein
LISSFALIVSFLCFSYMFSINAPANSINIVLMYEKSMLLLLISVIYSHSWNPTQKNSAIQMKKIRRLAKKLWKIILWNFIKPKPIKPDKCMKKNVLIICNVTVQTFKSSMMKYNLAITMTSEMVSPIKYTFLFIIWFPPVFLIVHKTSKKTIIYINNIEDYMKRNSSFFLHYTINLIASKFAYENYNINVIVCYLQLKWVKTSFFYHETVKINR